MKDEGKPRLRAGDDHVEHSPIDLDRQVPHANDATSHLLSGPGCRPSAVGPREGIIDTWQTQVRTDAAVSPWFLVAALAVPLAGLALLLGFPSLDAHWEHHPSHFWLVLGVALLNVLFGLIVSEVSRRSGDERLFLVSMVLLTSAGFLALHALATPGVVLSGPNGGFVLATPIGLLIASGFAALSSIEMDDRTEATLRRWQSPMRIGLVLVLLLWAAASLAGVPPLDRVIESERAPWLLALLPFGVGAYAFAAWRYLKIYRGRQRPLPLAVAVAFVFLAEALIAIAFGRAWQASWWEWHLLMAVAFATIVLAARQEYRGAPSLSGTFGGIYLNARWNGSIPASHPRSPNWCRPTPRARSARPPIPCESEASRVRRGRDHDGCGS